MYLCEVSTSSIASRSSAFSSSVCRPRSHSATFISDWLIERSLTVATNDLVEYPLSRIAVTISGDGRRGPARAGCRVEDRRRVGTNDHVPSRLHGFHPLRFVSNGDAWNLHPVRLLLHPAGIRNDHLGSVLQNDHVCIRLRW